MTNNGPPDSFASFETAIRNIRACWHCWHLQFDPNRVETEVEHQEFQRRHRAMDWVSPTFFLSVRAALLDYVLLGLGRLADGLETCGQPNVTVDRVFDETDSHNDDYLRGSAATARDAALKVLKSPEFKELRNKVLAHNDLDVALGIKAPNVDINAIEHALRAVSAFAVRIRTARDNGSASTSTGVGLYPDDVDAQRISEELSRLNEALRSACP